MSARKIPKNYRSVTGRIAFDGGSVPFESPLEADFYRLLRFDEGVESIRAQPAKVPFTRADGTPGHCYPDVLVTYRAETRLKPLLCEVKAREDLKKYWVELKPKLKAARKFATDNGWRFQIQTEVEIRTPYLSNADFLLEFRDREVDQLRCQRILRAFRSAEDWSIDKLVAWAAKELQATRAEILPLIWHLVATFQIPMNLHVPLDTRKPIVPARTK